MNTSKNDMATKRLKPNWRYEGRNIYAGDKFVAKVGDASTNRIWEEAICELFVKSLNEADALNAIAEAALSVLDEYEAEDFCLNAAGGLRSSLAALTQLRKSEQGKTQQ